MKNDKSRLFFIAILTMLILLTVCLYGYMTISQNKVNFGNILSLTIPLIIIIFMAFFVTRRYKDIKQNMPLEDERSKKVITQAAAKSFYISLYWLLAISWFESVFAQMFKVEHLAASQTIGGGIAGMAITFFACWFYYNKKGKLI